MKTEVPVRQGARTRETPLSGLGETGDQLRDPHRSGRPLPRGMLVGVGAGPSRMRRPQEPGLYEASLTPNLGCWLPAQAGAAWGSRKSPIRLLPAWFTPWRPLRPAPGSSPAP